MTTKLTGRFVPAQMKRDAYLRWVSCMGEGATLYEPQAALTLAGNVTSFVLLPSALGWWFVDRPLARRVLSTDWSIKLMGVSLVAGAITFLVTPRAASREIEVGRHPLRHGASQLAFALRISICDENLDPPTANGLTRLVRELGPY